MTPTCFDAIVVGAGQAGPSLAGRLAAAGRKVAIVERKLFGGTCVNTGCTPTKTLVASAYVAHKARTAQAYGINVAGPVTADMKALKARKDAVLMKSRNNIETWLRGMENCAVFTGHARFESPTEMRIGEDLITAPEIFLNVGGRAKVPEMPGVHEVPFLTNVSLLDLDELPRHLIVVGGSYVGIEFAQAFRRFGSEVTIVEMGPRLVQREDEDVSASVKEILEKEGIRIRLNAECITLAKKGQKIVVHVNCAHDASPSLGSHVLLAVGRRPNTDDLGLDKACVAIDKHGYIQVDDQLRTTAPGIWALGDCNGKGAFTHTAYNDFEIVAANLLDYETRRVTDRIPCYALYMDPPLARVGLNEREVRASGKPALIGTRPMTKVARATEKGETDGFMKVLVNAETKQILGASILGTSGDEAIHCILDTMYARAPYTTITHAMHIHPTVSELIPTVFEDMKPLS
ncbi:FAD-containing oxidoreductase [Edaphobacter aggregans]|uniref:FAD-containing oxidoreductase n=1 Tax=Edaphobacter aggregans TaxID=570835 RepID=UPI000554BC14|nr:FAD-containing oxidoreductase [Edaphobacter aggregans]